MDRQKIGHLVYYIHTFTSCSQSEARNLLIFMLSAIRIEIFNRLEKSELRKKLKDKKDIFLISKSLKSTKDCQWRTIFFP